VIQEARSKEEEEVCKGLRLAIVLVTMAGFTELVVLCDQACVQQT
jgi:hypothetical protein